MMIEHSREKARGPHRRWVFRIWVWVTVALAAYLLIAIPLADLFDTRFHYITAAVPAVMILLTFIGLGWLVWFITARKER